MQIRLTVVDPLGPPAPARGRATSCDVLVTAPAGTALAAVASALASAVSGGDSQVVLYAGVERLDAQRCTLGEPPLIDGAVLSLGAPLEPEPHPELDDAPTQLQVVAGPDAGGVHLLHGGEIRIGRSADADVPLDDPDVSRLHCAVTVEPDGRVSVADLGSTNGTTLDGTRVGTRAVRFTPGALLRIGESALRLAPAGGPGARVRTAPDGEGCVRVPPGDEAPHARVTGSPSGDTHRTYGSASWGAAGTAAPGTQEHDPAEPPVVPGQGGAPRLESHGTATGRTVPKARGGDTHGAGFGVGGLGAAGYGDGGGRAAGASGTPRTATGDNGSRAPHTTAGDNSPSAPRRATRGSESPAPDTATGTGSPGTPRTATGDNGSRAPHTTAGDNSPSAPRRATRGSESPAPGTATGTGSPGTPRTATGDNGSHAPHTTAGAGSPGTPRTAAGGDGSRASRTAAGDDSPGAPRRAARGSEAPAPGTAPGDHELAEDVASAGGRKGTPVRGTDVPHGVRKRGGLTAWARRLGGGRAEPGAARAGAYDEEAPDEAAAAPSVATGARAPETWPDPAALLLTALGPGPRLWERGPGHPEALTVRLGTADRAAPGGSGLLPAVPVTADLREAGALGLAGPRARLDGLARAVVAQLAALHSPDALEIVLISADRARPVEERTAEWSWLGWLPHLRPGHGQDCRLLLAYDREQAAARTDELLRRLEDVTYGTDSRRAPQDTSSEAPAGRTAAPRGAARRPSWARDDVAADETGGFVGPYTVVVVDGDPGGADLRKAVARLALEGPRAGIHVVCLAETASASPASPVTETYEAACTASPAFRDCGAVALLSGDVATALRLMRVARSGAGAPPGGAAQSEQGVVDHGTVGPVGHGTVAAVDAVSLAWAERFARALAPLRTDGAGERHARVSAPLPQAARLLDELGLARATPASLMARWADAADDAEALGGRAVAVLGAGPRGPVSADLVADGPHLLIEGPAGSGRTELLRALVASLAAAERPDRLSVVLMDGRDSVGAGGGHGEGLRVCTDVPHVTTHLTANDPVRMREFAQSLSAELKRRAELLGRTGFAEWHTSRELTGRMVAQRTIPARGASRAGAGDAAGAADLDTPPSSTLRLRPAAARRRAAAAPPPLPRLAVVVDDLDALVSPPLGSPGRPAAGSVIRALEAVAREGERLGVHLVAAAGLGGRTAQSEPARLAALRVTLDAVTPGPDEPAPGRGRLSWADGRITAFQGGRVTGRIPRTATLRPTVVPLEWHRMGDPPARRPVRELGNGPTDLALLASALERAAREVAAAEVPSLL
ncbi:FHA domain-containing protein [Streptomyces dysideae]|uniref:Cell division protein FtsK n=1 Tax=Streptomyces dysideae TaxID=909626 RepID=A0A117RZQ6_9ACTN|nr:FHA domain-containing protein [Streptomyces dysideae]KUO18470.1 hypothetical protein AQJ91_25020 [Streptomyces dysideae]